MKTTCRIDVKVDVAKTISALAALVSALGLPALISLFF
jgi:hypothetical protein